MVMALAGAASSAQWMAIAAKSVGVLMRAAKMAGTYGTVGWVGYELADAENACISVIGKNPQTVSEIQAVKEVSAFVTHAMKQDMPIDYETGQVDLRQYNLVLNTRTGSFYWKGKLNVATKTRRARNSGFNRGARNSRGRTIYHKRMSK